MITPMKNTIVLLKPKPVAKPCEKLKNLVCEFYKKLDTWAARDCK